MAKDPICGMEVNEKTTKFKLNHKGKMYYFCSRDCIEKYEKKYNIKSKEIFRRPWFKTSILILVILFSIFLIVFLQITGFMIWFMGGFFVIVALLKFLDWKGFASQFAMYDIIAKRSKLYSYLYPVIELALGLAFLFSFQLIITATVTFIIMTIGSIGVAQNLLSKNPVKCACLGTKIKLPLTKFTLFEDIIMAIMALMILFL